MCIINFVLWKYKIDTENNKFVRVILVTKILGEEKETSLNIDEHRVWMLESVLSPFDTVWQIKFKGGGRGGSNACMLYIVTSTSVSLGRSNIDPRATFSISCHRLTYKDLFGLSYWGGGWRPLRKSCPSRLCDIIDPLLSDARGR